MSSHTHTRVHCTNVQVHTWGDHESQRERQTFILAKSADNTHVLVKSRFFLYIIFVIFHFYWRSFCY